MSKNKRKRQEEKEGEDKNQLDNKKIKKNPESTTIPIYRGKFKHKWLKKHSSLLKHSESLKGIMITCGIQQETRALGSVSNLLDLFTNQLFPQAEFVSPIPLATLLMDFKDKEEKEEKEKENEVKKEEKIEEKNKPKRFEAIDTGCCGLIFYQWNINIDPTLFMYTLMNYLIQLPNDEKEKYKSLLRYTSRWIPLNFICHVTTERINDCVQHRVLPYLNQLVQQHDHQDEASNSDDNNNKKENTKKPSVAIVTELRNNIHFSKKDIIESVAPHLSNDLFTVDLNHPDYVIFVTIFKSVCGMSVLKNYYPYKKYNLIQYLSSSSS